MGNLPKRFSGKIWRVVQGSEPTIQHLLTDFTAFLLLLTFNILLPDRADSGGLDSLPPIVDKSQLFPLVTTYEDISEYQQISFKLLMLEIWEEVN